MRRLGNDKRGGGGRTRRKKRGNQHRSIYDRVIKTSDRILKELGAYEQSSGAFSSPKPLPNETARPGALNENDDDNDEGTLLKLLQYRERKDMAMDCARAALNKVKQLKTQLNDAKDTEYILLDKILELEDNALVQTEGSATPEIYHTPPGHGNVEAPGNVAEESFGEKVSTGTFLHNLVDEAITEDIAQQLNAQHVPKIIRRNSSMGATPQHLENSTPVQDKKVHEMPFVEPKLRSSLSSPVPFRYDPATPSRSGKSARPSSPSTITVPAASKATSPIEVNQVSTAQSPIKIPMESTATSPIKHSAGAQINNLYSSGTSPIPQSVRSVSSSPIKINVDSIGSSPIRRDTASKASSPICNRVHSTASSPIKQSVHSTASSPIKQSVHSTASSPMRSGTRSSACSPIKPKLQNAATSPKKLNTKNVASSPVKQQRPSKASSPIRHATNTSATSPFRQKVTSMATSPFRGMNMVGHHAMTTQTDGIFEHSLDLLPPRVRKAPIASVGTQCILLRNRARRQTFEKKTQTNIIELDKKPKQNSVSLQTRTEMKSKSCSVKPRLHEFASQTTRSSFEWAPSKESSCNIISVTDMDALESERNVLEKVLAQDRNMAALKLSVMQKRLGELEAEKEKLAAEQSRTILKVKHLLDENDNYFHKIATLELRNELLHRALNELKNSI